MATRAPFRCVLVGTDFSAGARRAVARAARLPFARDARLVVCHAAAADGADHDAPRRRIEEAVASAKREAELAGRPDLRVDGALAEGPPPTALVAQARRARAELVVVGRRGSSTLRTILLGSTPERIARSGESPLLVVRLPPTGPYRRPLVGVDGSPAARRALGLALRLVDRAVPSVPLLHAHEILYEGALRRGLTENAAARIRGEFASDRRRELHRLLAEEPRADGSPALRLRLRHGDPRRVLVEEVARRRRDLIAVGTRGRSRLGRLLLGSVADAVIHGAECDVLVVPRARGGGAR